MLVLPFWPLALAPAAESDDGALSMAKRGRRGRRGLWLVLASHCLLLSLVLCRSAVQLLLCPLVLCVLHCPLATWLG